MSETTPLIFLLDVDNTLLDNDQVEVDLKRHLSQAFGPEGPERYWTIFEKLRTELGYADYLGALQRYRVENPQNPRFLEVSYYLLDYPFADRLYPGALDVIKHLARWGPTVILSDGDVVFQPRKIQRSGLLAAVDHKVLVYIHKEHELPTVAAQYPAAHYVLIDDKPRILDAVKKIWGARVTTIFPRQGHYGRDAKMVAAYPPAGLTVDHIADLLHVDLTALLGRPPARA